MALSNEKLREYVGRLLLSRMRILCDHGFYGLLLMHMSFAVNEELDTACTDGTRITFGTGFLDELSESELDFVMMHEILHVALRHCLRGDDKNSEGFNIACDIVVNSNILRSNDMDISSITLKKYGESMHVAPNGKEGCEYTAEQVYEMLPKRLKQPRNGKGSANGSGSGNGASGNGAGESGGWANGRAQKRQGKASSTQGARWDDHGQWGTYEEDTELRDVWVKRVTDAAEAISVRDPSNSRGLLPAFAQRMLSELRRPQTDWRTLLCNFVQEDVVDYSFTPPDRRFSDSPFFLPDLNDTDERIKNVLFMVDTSGSVSDDMITAAYSEIKGAIDQFDGKLCGWLGFFDAAIIEPQPFCDEDELMIIRPAGGGGTDFQIIFEYVRKHMQDDPPSSIVILTDGYAPFPAEFLADGIPVLWVINNDQVDPPWGKVARIKID